MGFFDRFKGGGAAASDKTAPKAGAAGKWADRIDRRVQNYDRQEAIDALAAMGTVDAAEALLKRFTFHIDPSITDQDEKDAAFRGILRSGKLAIEPVRTFAAKAESLAWAMKIVRALLSEPEYVEELLKWLSRWDTEYSKFVDPKLQILTELEAIKQPDVAPNVVRFLEDVNEPTRFHAVCTLLAQDAPAVTEPLAKLLLEDESVRVRRKIAEGLASRGWPIEQTLRAEVRKELPAGFGIDADGRVVKAQA